MDDLQLIGTLPVSGINTGLQATTPALAAQVTSLGVDISQLGVAGAGQVALAATFPPDVAQYAAAIGAAISPAALGVSTGALPTTGVTLNLDILAQLIPIDASLAIVAPLDATLAGGLATDSLCAWSYSGSAPGFGLTLQRDTVNGFGPIGGQTNISAVIIATESFSSWGSLGQGINVGKSADAPAAGDNLTFLGVLRGFDVNLGVAKLHERISLFLGELRGKKSTLEASAQVALGFELPDIAATGGIGLQAIADLGLDGLLLNLTTQIDLGVGRIQAKLDALIALQGQLNAQLSAGGIVAWRYSGHANQLGAALAAATQNGLPGGSGPGASAYGLAVAALPSNMNSFGSIFLS